jgi:hypothetical protein
MFMMCFLRVTLIAGYPTAQRIKVLCKEFDCKSRAMLFVLFFDRLGGGWFVQSLGNMRLGGQLGGLSCATGKRQGFAA